MPCARSRHGAGSRWSSPYVTSYGSGTKAPGGDKLRPLQPLLTAQNSRSCVGPFFAGRQRPGGESDDRPDSRVISSGNDPLVLSGEERCGRLPRNTRLYARPPTLVSTALRACYRGGPWFEFTAAHHDSCCDPDFPAGESPTVGRHRGCRYLGTLTTPPTRLWRAPAASPRAETAREAKTKGERRCPSRQ